MRGLTVAVVVDGVGLATLSMNLEREWVGEVRHGLAVEGHLPRHHQRGLRKNERGHNRLASVVLRDMNFFEFLYVCPEPVLENVRLFS